MTVGQDRTLNGSLLSHFHFLIPAESRHFTFMAPIKVAFYDIYFKGEFYLYFYKFSSFLGTSLFSLFVLEFMSIKIRQSSM